MLHSSRIFAIYLIIFLIFVCLFAVNSSLSLNLSFLILPTAIVAIFFWRLKVLRFTSLLILVLVFAHFRIQQSIPERLNGSYEINGVVTSEPKIKGKTQKFIVKDREGGYLIEVLANQFPKYEFGDQVRITGKVVYDDLFDSKYKKDHLSGSARYPKIEKIDLNLKKYEELYFKLRIGLIRIRESYESKISLLLSEPEASLFSGILLGSRNDLSEQLISDLSRTGTIHIVALSGFNITILAEFMRLLTKRLSKKASTVIPLVTIWSFVLATGLSASIVRAAIMGSLLVFGQYLGRRSDSLVAVLLASSLMVFISPYILLYDIGFQLSFTATIGILYFAPKIERFFAVLGSYLGPMIATTLAAQIFTWPIVSYYFGSVSLIAPLVNIFILPFIPALMLLGFLSTTIGFFSVWLGAKLAFLVWVMLGYFLKTISVYSNLSFASININIASVSFIIGYYLVLLDLLLIVKRFKRVEKTTV